MLPDETQHIFNSSSVINSSFSPEDLEVSVIGSWFLMKNPVPFLTLILAYLFVVLKFGPENMKSRSPYNIKYIVMVYNLTQIAININLFLKITLTPGSLHYLLQHSCHPMNIVENPLRMDILEGTHLYFVSKVLDLSDTVFFVLKKKQSHVSFLHVYHHTLMATGVWTYLKYYRGEEGIIIGLLNSFVHIVMYSYYFLSGLGPEVQKYLWWKRYITKLQLVQFGLVLLWMLRMVFYRCQLSKFILYLGIGNCFFFIYLFTDFYLKSYCKKDKKSCNKSEKSS